MNPSVPGQLTFRSMQELMDMPFDELACTIGGSRPAVPHLPRLIALEATAAATLGGGSSPALESAQEWAGRPRSPAADGEPGLLLLPPILSPPGSRERSAPTDFRGVRRSLSWGSSALGRTGPLNRSLPSTSHHHPQQHHRHQHPQYNTMRISIQFGGSGLPTVHTSGAASTSSMYSYSGGSSSSGGGGRGSSGSGGRGSSAGNYEALLTLDGDNVRRAVRPEVMRVLPMRLATRAEDEGSECQVCLDKFKPGSSRVLSLPCGHTFCTKCIRPWLEQHHTCPTCRWAFPDSQTQLVLAE